MFPDGQRGKGLVLSKPERCHGNKILMDELYVQVNNIDNECNHPVYGYPVEAGCFTVVNSDHIV